MNSVDILGQFNTLLKEAQTVLTSIDLARKREREMVESQEEETNKLQVLVSQMGVQKEGMDLLLKIIDQFSFQQLESVRGMINTALKTIFFDRDYSIKFEISDKRGAKNLDIFLIEKMESGEVIESDIKDSVGGGIATIVGLMLRLYFILYFKVAKVVVLDEALTKLSEFYMSRLMEFLKRLSDELGFIFILVTHEQRVMAFADKQFFVNKGEIEEKLFESGVTPQ